MNRGFTLIELVVVLVILAILTSLGVHEFGQIRDQRLSRQADRQLEEIRDAARAFEADTGLGVPLTNGTLAALWQRPGALRDAIVLPAVRTNLFAGAASSLVDANVFVPIGWKGPYLRLPLGKTRLFDPWGNEFLTADRDPAGRARVTASATTGEAVAAAHFGPTSLLRDEHCVALVPERHGRDLASSRGGGVLASALRVKVVSVGGKTELPSEITYRWYGPAGNVITGAVATVAANTYAVFEDLTPGKRIVTESATGSIREIDLAPGDVNLVEIKVP